MTGIDDLLAGIDPGARYCAVAPRDLRALLQTAYERGLAERGWVRVEDAPEPEMMQRFIAISMPGTMIGELYRWRCGQPWNRELITLRSMGYTHIYYVPEAPHE